MNAQEQEKRAEEQFNKLIDRHVMAVLHDEGLYRHVRFRRPDELAYYFDLVTWPGYLAINGDLISGYTFTRIEDMFSFFDVDRINPMYWSEKITCPSINVQKTDPDFVFDPATMDEAPWEWDHSFLLSCHAIVWGVRQYRNAGGMG